MRGWTPSEEMKAKSQAARAALMQTSKDFRDRSLSGLAKSRQDPEVKRKRAEGNRRRLLPVRLEFERWLTQKPEDRVPLTQVAFQRRFGISGGTITKWKWEVLKGKLEVAVEITNSDEDHTQGI
jgi:hypothetical protein